MPRLVKKRSRKTGLPPGTLIPIGEDRGQKTRITRVEYDEQSFREEEIGAPPGCFVPPQAPAVTWVNVDGVRDVDVLANLGRCFELHPLVQEDILNTDQRPKIEDYGEDLFVVLKCLTYNNHSEGIEAEQISLLLRPPMLLSFQEKEGDSFTPIKEMLRQGKGRLRKMGADYLCYMLLDVVVDRYFSVLESLGEKIESVEGRLLADPTPETLLEIQNLKRDMLFMRKWVWPLREVVNRMERGDFSAVQESTRLYLRDVYDHTVQVIETIEIFREMLSGMVDIYLSSVNNRLTGVMKVLTIIATIFMPLTFLAGLYGMNFKFMPELGWRWGYPAALGLMGCVAGVMLMVFKKKKWF
ncbi:MAG TPA: magnesium/cobalt transporter CorA [Thermodesulfobacteriota bacterium]|nr:magnesium/cobalt transporter CorA [Thermodesulfobacteriota bacterium]